VFFVAFNRADLFVATGAFMVAVAIAIGVSWTMTRHVPPMTWFTAALVGVFGGLTLWLQDETFIKVKPTIVFLIFSGILWFGIARRRNYLKMLLGSAFTGLSDRGWHLLSLRWAIFFAVLAGLNEMFWRLFPTEIWVHFKVWGDTLLTFVFALAQIPFLKRHGLKLD
jgi:intracellular septation protein